MKVTAEKQLQTKNDELEKAKQDLKSKESKIKTLKQEKQKLQQKFWREGKKITDCRKTLEEEIVNERADLELKQKELELREKELDYLQSIYENDTIRTFHEGKYTDEVRLCIMELLSMNVSINKVNEIICIVLNRLANKKIEKLPSKGLRC